jgi:DNA polymerase-4
MAGRADTPSVVALCDGRSVGEVRRRRRLVPEGHGGSWRLRIRLHLCEHAFVSGEATILHADLDAFYASVEQRDDPRLRGRPVIVGAGVVLAASYEAKACGIRTAMNGRQARMQCPQAIVVEPRMSAYAEASKAVFEVFEHTTPLVEGLSIDEAFLDVGGLRRISGTPTEIAGQLRRDVRERVGLPITVGVARTKFLAKVASGVAKPDGLLVVRPDAELAFLHPLPVERLWGVGPVTSRKLRDRGVMTVGEVAELGEAALVSMLGRGVGRHLHALAHNRDPRPVQVGRRRQSIGSQRALGRKPRSRDDIDAEVAALVDRVTRRMRAAGRVGRTVVLRLRFDDFSRATRSHTLPWATAHTQTILDALRALLAAAMPMIERRGLTLVAVAVSNLTSDRIVQPPLPFDADSEGDLDVAVDAVRDRFGSSAITRGVLLGRDQGLSMPMLPD